MSEARRGAEPRGTAPRGAGVLDRLAELLYRACLRLYPDEFRRRFGRRMLGDFRRLGAAEPHRGRRLVVYLRELGDVVGASRKQRRGDGARLDLPGAPAGPAGPAAPLAPPRPDARASIGGRVRQALGDVRLAGRTLAARPGYSLLAVAILGLGTGAGAAMFSVLDATLFRPAPYRDPHEVVQVVERSVERPQLDRLPVAPANYLDWKRSATVFWRLEASRSAPAILAVERHAERVPGVRVTPGLFALLGVEAVHGRTFADGEADDEVVVVSHGFWRRVLGGDPAAVGGTLQLDDRPHTVVGVMPEDFRYPFLSPSTELWRPLRLDPATAADRDHRTLEVIGRLPPGVSRQQAQRRMDALAAAIAGEHPEAADTGANVLEYPGGFLEDLRPILWLLAGAVGVVLLIACVNVAGLVVARSVARGRELAIRRALGCGRRRLAWSVVAEALLLALAGGLAGLLVARAGIALILPLAPE